jgi:hypothetical protein
MVINKVKFVSLIQIDFSQSSTMKHISPAWESSGRGYPYLVDGDAEGCADLVVAGIPPAYGTRVLHHRVDVKPHQLLVYR